MKFVPTAIVGAFIVEQQAHVDDRGSFARVFCAQEFETHGLAATIAQASVATTLRRGTIRGMHWQVGPEAESKYVQCLRGVIVDQIVDVRPQSPTYLQHVSVELGAGDGRGLFVPPGCAHGYQTLTDDTLVSYAMNQLFTPDRQCGARYDDPMFRLEWPLDVTVISGRDRGWPPFVAEG